METYPGSRQRSAKRGTRERVRPGCLSLVLTPAPSTLPPLAGRAVVLDGGSRTVPCRPRAAWRWCWNGASRMDEVRVGGSSAEDPGGKKGFVSKFESSGSGQLGRLDLQRSRGRLAPAPAPAALAMSAGQQLSNGVAANGAEPSPIKTRQTAKTLDGVHTEVVCQAFADRYLVLVTQLGKVGCLVRSNLLIIDC